jgi:hypothetical protein
MRKAIDDGLSRDQLRRIDRSMLLLLAAILAAAFLAALASSGTIGPFATRLQKAGQSPSETAGATTGASAVDHSARDYIGKPRHFYRSYIPNGAQKFDSPKLNGELRQSLPLLY